MRAAIGVFARAPIPGETKTRLIPAVGAEGAARLHEAFLRDVLRRAASVAPVTLFVAGPLEHPSFDALGGAEVTFERRPQRGDDLGARMTHALAHLRTRADRAVLVGSDAPTLPARVLRAAIHHPAEQVLTPTADGGYALVGGRRPFRFEGIRWSASTTLAETLARNPGAHRTEPWYDVDRPEDLALLRAHLTLDPGAAPCTAAALAATVA